MMKKILALLVLVTSLTNAQEYSIKGTMSPPEKNDWVILYKIQGAKQKFIANTTIKVENVSVNGQKQKFGKFEFKLPADAPVGAYRATYKQKGGGFVDFLFNKENIEFVFNPTYPEQSIVYTSSQENKVYNEYLQATALTQKTIDSLQIGYIKSASKDLKKAYKKAVSKLEDVQKIYNNKSKGMLAHEFIKASERYNPSSVADNMDDYLASVLKNFFNNVDFNSKELYNSSFLIDRITDYVFFLNYSEEQNLQKKLYKDAITKVMNKASKPKLRKEVAEFLISQFTDKRDSEIVDWMLADYYDKLPSNFKDAKFRDKKLKTLKATVGRIAPDFSWKEGGKAYKLSTINDGKNYLLVFWSTGCSHCVKEIPVLYDFMKGKKDTSIIAFGIEHDDLEWNQFIKKLYGWHNVMGTHPTNKWENKTVRTYQLIATPSYFVLDKNKKIIAMPNTIEDVKNYFSK